MAMLFTSDLHLGHRNILLSRQQFASIDEHDEFIIRQWNKKVHKNDNVYILGDLSFRAEQPISYYLSRMKGKKHLIVGNHDSFWMKNIFFYTKIYTLYNYLLISSHISPNAYSMGFWGVFLLADTSHIFLYLFIKQ